MKPIKLIKLDTSINFLSKTKPFVSLSLIFIIASTLDVVRNWDRERRAIPQICDQYNDLLPKISVIGLNKQQGTGVTYQSLTSLIPLSVGFAMVYDIYRQKNKFYWSTNFIFASLPNFTFSSAQGTYTTWNTFIDTLNSLSFQTTPGSAVTSLDPPCDNSTFTNVSGSTNVTQSLYTEVFQTDGTTTQ